MSTISPTIETDTRSRILLIIEEKGEVTGTETLAAALGLINNKSYVIRSARRLADDDKIAIYQSRGGRGHKTRYKSAQPGIPRKVRR